MEIKFIPAELEYLRQLRRNLDSKQAGAARAQGELQEADDLLRGYFNYLAKIHGCDGQPLTLLADFTGFVVPDIPARSDKAEKRVI